MDPTESHEPSAIGVLIEGGVALAAAIVLSGWAARAWLRYRARLYQKHEEEPLDGSAYRGAHPVLQLELAPEAEKARKWGTDLLNTGHWAAAKTQDRYHAWVARAVASIGLGFIGLCIGVTVGANSSAVARFTAALDVACFAISLFSFWRVVQLNWLWLRARIRNELLRQWCSIDNLLMSLPTPPDVQGRMGLYSRRVDEEVLGLRRRTVVEKAKSALKGLLGALSPGTPKELELILVERVDNHWNERRSELELALTDQSLTREQIATHFWKRPFKQLEWFTRSNRRLVEQVETRSHVILSIFALTVLFALLKLAVVLHVTPGDWSPSKPYLALIIFALIAVSSMLTALYLNQNARSLIHRYRTQKRKIEAWIKSYEPTLAECDAAPGGALPAALSTAVISQAMTFEQLMIDELLDWIAITQNDIMELAP